MVAYADAIRVLCKQNDCLSSARNAGILAAQGDYVAFLWKQAVGDLRRICLYIPLSNNDMTILPV
jgi:hypothetical protein